MSIRIDASGDDLRRTANLPDESAFTMCGWSYVVADRGASYQALGGIEGSGGTWNILYWEGGTSDAMAISSGAAEASFASRPATGTWFFWAVTSTTAAAGSLIGYWSAANSNTFNTQSTTGQASTVNRLTVGNDTALSWLSGRFQYVKCWDAVLTQAELEQEKWSATPKRFANLNFWWPARNSAETQDWGNNKRNATATGTLTTEDGPPVTWSGVPIGFRSFSPAVAGNDIVAAGSLSITGVADLDATGSLVAAGTASITGVADLDATGALLAAGSLSITGVADLDALGQLIAAGSLSINGAADLDAIGNLLAAGSLSISGLAELSGSLNDIVATGSLSITGVAALTALGELAATGTIVLTGLAELTSSAVAAPAETATGGWIFSAYERELLRRRDEEVERRKREEESEEITDDTTREIALLLRAQEAADARRAEIERLGTLAAQFADRQAQEAFTERMAKAHAKAIREQSAAALIAFERAIEEAREEEGAAIMFILNQDD